MKATDNMDVVAYTACITEGLSQGLRLVLQNKAADFISTLTEKYSGHSGGTPR